jgi:hypothetical protein
MSASDAVLQRALVKLLGEIFDGPPGSEAYLLNPGDPGGRPAAGRCRERRRSPPMSITSITG